MGPDQVPNARLNDKHLQICNICNDARIDSKDHQVRSYSLIRTQANQLQAII